MSAGKDPRLTSKAAQARELRPRRTPGAACRRDAGTAAGHLGAGKDRRAYVWVWARSHHDPHPGVIHELCLGGGARSPWCARASPMASTSCAVSRSAPARMSSGCVHSHGTSMRITAATRAARPRNGQSRPPPRSRWRWCGRARSPHEGPATARASARARSMPGPAATARQAPRHVPRLQAAQPRPEHAATCARAWRRARQPVPPQPPGPRLIAGGQDLGHDLCAVAPPQCSCSLGARRCPPTERVDTTSTIVVSEAPFEV